MPWYAMGLSIMATQASAITFISTTGQSYVDGMRFVQFYFGLPHRHGRDLRHGGSDFSSRQRLHRVRIPGEALRRQDARAGQRDLSEPARAFRGPHDLRAGDRAVGDSGLAGPRHHPAHGRAGGHLHGAGRHQGRHVDGRAADVRDFPRPDRGADHGDRAAAAFGFVRRRGLSGGRGGTPERRRPRTSIGTTATTSGAACWAARSCCCPISAATSRRCSAI